jgi:hypothetical protein
MTPLGVILRARKKYAHGYAIDLRVSLRCLHCRTRWFTASIVDILTGRIAAVAATAATTRNESPERSQEDPSARETTKSQQIFEA